MTSSGFGAGRSRHTSSSWVWRLVAATTADQRVLPGVGGWFGAVIEQLAVWGGLGRSGVAWDGLEGGAWISGAGPRPKPKPYSKPNHSPSPTPAPAQPQPQPKPNPS
jgi:hypothetical protein